MTTSPTRPGGRWQPGLREEIAAAVYAKLTGGTYDPAHRHSKKAYDTMKQVIGKAGYKWYPKLGLWLKQESLFEEDNIA